MKNDLIKYLRNNASAVIFTLLGATLAMLMLIGFVISRLFPLAGPIIEMIFACGLLAFVILIAIVFVMVFAHIIYLNTLGVVLMHTFGICPNCFRTDLSRKAGTDNWHTPSNYYGYECNACHHQAKKWYHS